MCIRDRRWLFDKVNDSDEKEVSIDEVTDKGTGGCQALSSTAKARIRRLERKLEQIKINHEEKVDEYKRQVGKIHKLVHDKDTEMGSLKAQIEQLEASVLEREAIHSIQTATKDDSADATQRFADVHMKRKLQTLVGMQTQEIELLRDELDRLRRRTFPTFTHLEARRAGPRDN